jgi:hypothetical protein
VGVTLSDLDKYARSSGVGLSVVSDLGTPFEKDHRDVLDGGSQSGIVRFAGISPDFDPNSDRIDDTVLGIRIYPTYQKWDFAGAKWRELLAWAKDEDKIVQVYLRLRDARYMQQVNEPIGVIAALEESIAEYRSIDFVISGAQTGEILDRSDLLSGDNVWTEIAHLQGPINSLQKVIAAIGSSRILFGSNIPFFYTYAGVFRIENTSISDDEKRRILYDNATTLLKSRAEIKEILLWN